MKFWATLLRTGSRYCLWLDCDPLFPWKNISIWPLSFISDNVREILASPSIQNNSCHFIWAMFLYVDKSMPFRLETKVVQIQKLSLYCVSGTNSVDGYSWSSSCWMMISIYIITSWQTQVGFEMQYLETLWNPWCSQCSTQQRHFASYRVLFICQKFIQNVITMFVLSLKVEQFPKKKKKWWLWDNMVVQWLARSPNSSGPSHCPKPCGLACSLATPKMIDKEFYMGTNSY